MSIPNFQELMLPLLEAYSNGQEKRWVGLSREIAQNLKLTKEEEIGFPHFTYFTP